MNVLDKRRTLVRDRVAKVSGKGKSINMSLVIPSSLINRCRGLSQRILDRSCIMKMSCLEAQKGVFRTVLITGGTDQRERRLI